MRLYPPAFGLGRETTQPCTMDNYTAPRGAVLAVYPWVIHRHPQIYADPERFDPDRWLPEPVRNVPRYAYLPFGAGPRMCIGNTLGIMVTVLLTACIARRFRLELAPGVSIKPWPMITLRPALGHNRYSLPMVLPARR